MPEKKEAPKKLVERIATHLFGRAQKYDLSRILGV
jgi:hypothetical protein